MKYFLTLLLITTLLQAKSQVVTFPENESGAVEYKGIDEVKASKEQIYKRVKLWISKTFADPKAVLKLDDQASGLIKVTFNNPPLDKNFSFTQSIQIEIKDNKLRYTVSNILIPTEASYQDNMTAEGLNRRIKEKTEKGKKPSSFLTSAVTIEDMEIKSIINSLITSVAKDDDF